MPPLLLFNRFGTVTHRWRLGFIYFRKIDERYDG